MIFGPGTQSVVEEGDWCWHCALRFFRSSRFPSPLDGLEWLDTDAFVSLLQSCTCHVALALANVTVEGGWPVGF